MLVISCMLNSKEPDVRAISPSDCHRNLGSVPELYCLQNNLEHIYNICTISRYSNHIQGIKNDYVDFQ